MSKLSALKKQIAALEAQAERLAKVEMASAIGKIKDLMSEFNVTIEHLTQSVAGKRSAKQTKAKAAAGAKYADPKTGKTWSGFGRAPGWIASEKNRDSFLVDKGGVQTAKPAGKNQAVDKKSTVKVAKAVNVAKKRAKPTAKKVASTAKKAAVAAAVPTAAKKPAVAKKAAARKMPAKKGSAKAASTVPSESKAAPAA